jgi:hypothetical protein
MARWRSQWFSSFHGPVKLPVILQFPWLGEAPSDSPVSMALWSSQCFPSCQETCWVFALDVLGQRGSPQGLGWNARVGVWSPCPAGWPALPNSSSCSVQWRSSTNSTRHWPRPKAGCCRIVSQSCHDVWV